LALGSMKELRLTLDLSRALSIELSPIYQTLSPALLLIEPQDVLGLRLAEGTVVHHA
jgi:hypothetical protein